MRSSLAVFLCTLLATGNLLAVLATPDVGLSLEKRDAPANLKNARSILAARKWDTKTPKLENPVDRAKRRNKRVSTLSVE